MEETRSETEQREAEELRLALVGLGHLSETAAAEEGLSAAIDRLRATFGWDKRGEATGYTRRAIRIQVAALQRKLAALGHYRGEAHGSFDEATTQALKGFQAGLEPPMVTGVLDEPTRDALAALPPYTFDEVLCRELDAVNHGRTEAGQSAEEEAAHSGNAIIRAHQARLLGLAFSGGGIRSATFNLGVLQSLARLGLLRRVDYLSTVSGGGYIGSWLHAWVHREPRGIVDVERQLAGAPGAAAHEPRQLSWLRQYSNYLTPRVGLLSADTMAGVGTWLRNVLLNQAVLGALGLAALCLPWLLFALVGMPWWQDSAASIWITALGTLLLALASWIGGAETGLIEGGGSSDRAAGSPITALARRRWAYAVVIMVALAALLLGLAGPFALRLRAVPALMGGAALGLVQALSFFLGWFARRPGHAGKAGALLAALAGGLVLALVTAVLLTAADGGNPAPLHQPWERMLLVVLAPPAIMVALLSGATVHIGALGRSVREASREWWSRTGGIVLSAMLGWLAVAGVALLGSYSLLLAGGWVSAMGGFLWLATTTAGVLLARSPATNGGTDGWKDKLATLAPWVFVAGLLLLLAYALHAAFLHAGGTAGQKVCKPVPDDSVPGLRSAYRFNLEVPVNGGSAAAGEVLRVEPHPGCDVKAYGQAAADALDGRAAFLLWPLGFLGLALLLGRRVDVNVFSFHMFYRNRLERCFLGASNPRRRGHAFTHLDPDDSPRLAELERGGSGQRPYPLINTALNITRSDNLAWQERKAASFLFSPQFCGYQFPDAAGGTAAYQKTEAYLSAKRKPAWLSLGTPVTISGAAASPNAGYHTHPATAFLMTVFNVRLGWWMQNPRKLEHWARPGPRQSVPYLLKELLASASDADPFVYLSDGGHFENLGIYELVRRRCRYIIACDAGCDPHCTFEDLGNAIRKCRIDLGIEIDIDPAAIVPDPATGHSLFHCAVGTIHYERRDPVATPGYLLYIKASLTGAEPTDVRQYKAEHAAFPHESTGDQWYSESQFESYRKLGCHVAERVFAQARKDALQRGRANAGASATDVDSPCDQEQIFNALAEQWYRPSRAGLGSFAKHGAELEEIHDRLRSDGNLRFLDAQIYPEWVKLSERIEQGPRAAQPTMLPRTEDELRAGFYLCNTLIQLMENVYVDLRLEEEHAHPDNRGWMNLFRHWSWCGMFRVTWAICVATYGARFQHFCRRHLDLESGDLALAQPVRVGAERWQERINVVEQDHVRRIMEGHGALRADHRLEVQPLEIRVRDPFREQPDFVFPVGFALLERLDGKEEPGLVYYRIQDHLRRMGLGRQGLRALQATYGKMYVAMPDALGEIIGEADPGLLQHLWHLEKWSARSAQEQKKRA